MNTLIVRVTINIMIPANSDIYLETSAINYLADKYNHSDAMATKIYHSLKGTRFFISPVTVWEILSTADPLRRESLIFYAQHLCHYDLLNTPSEFIVNFILSGCPSSEKKYNFRSLTGLADTWSDICHNPAKTFVYDKRAHDKKTLAIRQGFMVASRFIESLGLGEVSFGPNFYARLGLDETLKRLKGIEYKSLTPREIKRYKISLILMLIILCYGIDFDPSPISDFWSRVGLSKTRERLAYLLTDYESLIYAGPFALMSETAISQLQIGGKVTRGIFWDTLHSLYLVYLDIFLTADSHFRDLREQNSHFNFKKIVFLKDARIFNAEQIDLDNPPENML